MDRLVNYEKDGQNIRECVSCDFSEQLVANVAPNEIETRVNKVPGEESDDVSAVKILDPKSLN